MGGRLHDLSGEIFGFLHVDCRAEQPTGTKGRLSFWNCSCRCGRTGIIVRSDDLRSGRRRKCSPTCPYVLNRLQAVFPVMTISDRGTSTRFLMLPTPEGGGFFRLRMD